MRGLGLASRKGQPNRLAVVSGKEQRPRLVGRFALAGLGCLLAGLLMAQAAGAHTTLNHRNRRCLRDLPPLELDEIKRLVKPAAGTAKAGVKRAGVKRAGVNKGEGKALRAGPKVFTMNRLKVIGQRRVEAAPAAKYQLDLGQLRIIPRKSSAEHLMLAPGVLTTNHGGEGHAREIFMRGFAAREGQDIEFLVDGVPLNEIGNPHGHGYTDLLFIPPEFIHAVVITEGPFDPAQGDFSFAGSANYRLAVKERGSRLRYTVGSFGTQRLLLTVAPEKLNPESFAGFEFQRTGGFGPNRSAQRALGLARYAGAHEKWKLRWKVSLYGYAARYDQAGVVRHDDYRAGKIGFFDTYDTNQGGESSRLLFSLHTSLGPKRSFFEQVAFFGYRSMRMRANFTGFLNDTLIDPDGTSVPEQRGDGIEMGYKVLTGGARGSYTLSRYLLNQEQKLSLGYAIRFDRGRSSQSRLRSLTAIPYRRLFDHEFSVLNLAGWLGLNFRPLAWAAFRGGLRVDAFSFGVTDFNQPASDREGTRLPEQSAQAFGYGINPRGTLDFTLAKGLHLLLSYGQGTRSTDAAALSDNETAPFALAHQGDLGLSYQFGRKGGPLALKVQASYVFTRVDKDMLFDEGSGRNVSVGASTRHALLLSARLNLGRWFDGLFNFGWTQGTLDDTGELIPYIPQVIARLDLAARGRLFKWQLGGRAVTGRVGLGVTLVPGRPLPFNQFGDTLFVVNLAGEVRLWYFSLGFEIRNLFDRRYRQAEFNYASNFQGPRAVPSRVPMRHFVAGEPFTLMGTLTFHLEALFTGNSPKK